jgi:hypothetical protein
MGAGSGLHAAFPMERRVTVEYQRQGQRRAATSGELRLWTMTDPADLDTTRASYDAVAADHAELVRTALATRPWDRSVLAAFAESTRRRSGCRSRSPNSIGSTAPLPADARLAR